MNFDPNSGVAIDTETSGLNSWKGDRPFSVSVCDTNKRTVYCEWSVDPLTRIVTPDPADIAYLNSICKDTSIPKVFHNRRFDQRMLESVGVEFAGVLHDTVIAAKVVNMQEPSYGLKPLAVSKLGIPDDDQRILQDVVKKLRLKARKLGWSIAGEYQADYWLVQHIDILMPELSRDERDEIRGLNQQYCCMDTIRTMALWEHYAPMIEADPCHRKIYPFELEVMDAIYDMETRGVFCNVELCKQEIKHHSDKMTMLLDKLRVRTGNPAFNPNSGKQIGNFLYGDMSAGNLGLRPSKFTSSGQPGTDWRSLMNFKNVQEVRWIVQYKSSSKAISTFFENYINYSTHDPVSGLQCVRPTINQLGARTGRFSMSEPNMQQVSNSETNPRDTEPVQARMPFGPRPGHVWYTMDYAQQELRIFADRAEVHFMLEAIDQGRDLNTENANRVWGGIDNQAGHIALCQTLELGLEDPSENVRHAWDWLQWSSEKAKHGPYSQMALETARRWLVKFEGDIVAAEASIGKKATRNKCKMLMFNKIYGGGHRPVMALLLCDEAEARSQLRLLDRNYPEIADYHARVIRGVHENGYILTSYGRKINVEPDAAYKGVNYGIQGTAADMMKTAMVNIRRHFNDLRYKGRKLSVHPVLTVHDELITEVRCGDDYPWVVRTIRNIMTDTEAYMKVPMEVEVSKVVERWDHKEKIAL